jgi:hypothetical protein
MFIEYNNNFCLYFLYKFGNKLMVKTMDDQLVSEIDKAFLLMVIISIQSPEKCNHLDFEVINSSFLNLII